MKPLVLFLLAFFASSVYADKEDLNSLQKQQDWYIVKQDNTRHITTYAKREEGKSILSFKIDATVDASLATLASIHFDVANLKKWYWETLESKLISKVSDTEYIYYLRFKTPLAPDRDAVLKAKIEPYHLGHNDYMLLSLRATPSALPIPDNVTRISAFDMDIKFTPLVDGKTKMEVQGYVDPSGNLPAWTVNLFQHQAPYATMVGLYRMTKRQEYQKLSYPLAYRYTK
ncbi:MAG: START domain-containing protein [Agitococcus sp.]